MQKDIVAQRNANGYGWWRGPVMLPYSTLKEIGTIKKARLQRDKKEPTVQVIMDAGWHYSFMGGSVKIMEKIKSWAHFTDTSYKGIQTLVNNPDKVAELVSAGKSIFLDENMTFAFIPVESNAPRYVIENIEDFKHLIHSK